MNAQEMLAHYERLLASEIARSQRKFEAGECNITRYKKVKETKTKVVHGYEVHRYRKVSSVERMLAAQVQKLRVVVGKERLVDNDSALNIDTVKVLCEHERRASTSAEVERIDRHIAKAVCKERRKLYAIAAR